MSSLAFLGFVLLSSFAVWEGTERRLGTLDELRMLGGVAAAILIFSGVSVLLA